ncbi:MAG: DUF4124 domain-containing protein [Oleispira sp.]
MNKKILTCGLSILLLCLPLSVNATEVFITIDENGNRIFSDIPSTKSRKHKIKEISIIPAIKVNKTTATAIDNEELSTTYQQLTIIGPTTESNIGRENLGNFVVSAQSDPVLSANDEAVLLFDGEEISTGKQMNWKINSADRGAHRLQVIIRNQNNQKQIISSPIVTVYVKR